MPAGLIQRKKSSAKEEMVSPRVGCWPKRTTALKPPSHQAAYKHAAIHLRDIFVITKRKVPPAIVLAKWCKRANTRKLGGLHQRQFGESSQGCAQSC